MKKLIATTMLFLFFLPRLSYAAETPANTDIHVRLGVNYFKLGKYDQAAGELQKALKLDPQIEDVHGILGVALFHLKSYDEALEVLETAVRLNPDITENYYNLGLVYLEKGMTNEAIRTLQQALELSPDQQKFTACLVFYTIKME